MPLYRNDNQILKWLAVNILMVVMMVIIGGITRLTDSGLSMTEWKLIGGVIPPINENDWSILFEKYKNFPEFNLKNFDFELIEFKKIFFWEYFHRIWGRLIGITYTFPFLFFLAKGMFDSNEKKIYLRNMMPFITKHRYVNIDDKKDLKISKLLARKEKYNF